MASKKYKLKTCAYCGKEKASEVQEHVIAREFVLERFRDGMPAVPACKRCNTKKSALETYAMAVLPFGSLLANSEEYIAAKLEGRLAKNPKLRRELATGRSEQWVRQNGVLIRQMTMPLRHDRINDLVAMIVRGLFMHEFGFALRPNWTVRVTNFLPEAEAMLMPRFMDCLGPGPLRVDREIADGVVRYTAWRSQWGRYWSIWHLTLFGGLLVGGDPDVPDMSFSRWSAVTVRDDSVSEPDDDELPDVEGMNAWLARNGGASPASADDA